MAKQTTCFSDEQYRLIELHIAKLASRHNDLIIEPTMAKLDMAAALELFIPPADREYAVAVHQRYGRYLNADAYEVGFRKLPVFKHESPRLYFWWREAKNDPRCFPMHQNQQIFTLSEGLQSSPLVPELFQMLNDWIENAIEWGVVKSVIKAINDIALLRNVAYAGYLLPALVPVVARFDKALATKMARKGSDRGAWPVECLDGLRFANRKLASAFLLPEDVILFSGPISMRITDPGECAHPAWPALVQPMLGR